MAKVGDTVFFRHDRHSWILGTIEETSRGVCACRANDRLRGVVTGVATNLSVERDIYHVIESLIDEDVDDLLHLTVLHDSTLLRCLYLRYITRDVIYTNVGAIVVALNPFTFSISHCQRLPISASTAEA